MNLQPKTATVLRDGRETEIPAAEVVQGDTVLVRRGRSLSVDGVVLTGKSAVDESMLTGESMAGGQAAGRQGIRAARSTARAR